MTATSRYWTFAIPVILVVIVVGVIPFVIAGWISLTDLHFHLPDHDGGFVGGQNYAAALNDERFWHSLGRSVGFVAICIPVEAFLGGICAVLVHALPGWRRTLLAFLLLPVLLAPVTVGLIWRLILHGDYGPLGFLITQVSGESILATRTGAFAAICLVDIWQWSPFFAILIFLGMNATPASLRHAAALDGAGRISYYRHVLFPQITPVIWLAAILRTLDAFKDFDKIHGLTAGGPASATELQSIYCYILTFTRGDVAVGAAMSLVVFAALVVAVNVVFTFWKDMLR